jgi:hypothetical protein
MGMDFFHSGKGKRAELRQERGNQGPLDLGLMNRILARIPKPEGGCDGERRDHQSEAGG